MPPPTRIPTAQAGAQINDNPDAPVFGQHKFDYDSTAVLANVYYDFDLRSRFTPYIGIGLGVVHNKTAGGRGVTGDSVGTQGPGIPITIGAADKWSVAGAFMTGFTFALRDRLSFDAGYRFLYLGDAKTGQITNTQNGGVGGEARIEDLHAHEFRIGLRYDIR